jgi:23S rRNA (uracil1939-C5)-methyltransferase
VGEAFARQDLMPRQWLDPIFLGGNNRRRATFATVKTRGRVLMGYYRRRSDEITRIDTCQVLQPELLALREALKPFLARVLDEETPVDVFLQRVGDIVDLVLTGPLSRDPRGALAGLLESTPVARISWRESGREHPDVLLAREPMTATFGKLQVALPPAAFLQPTEEGERALTGAVMAALPEKGRFADLFSGCGTFTGPMLERGPVDAYEAVPRAVTALTKAAGERPLRAFKRDLYRRPLSRVELNRYDAIVLDPPRSGCPEQAAELATAKVPVLVGVSCNPATFARDARILAEGGYRLQSLQLIDQFLWSHHVEVVGVFTKGRRR